MPGVDSTVSEKPSFPAEKWQLRGNLFRSDGLAKKQHVTFLFHNNLDIVYHHTKTLGDLGLLKAQLDLFEKGFVVAVPFTEHAPFDLIIYRDGKCRTVQVKTRSVNGRGFLEIQFKNNYSDSRGLHAVAVDKHHIDLYGLYCPDTDLCYYFDPQHFNKSVSLRVSVPKNNQRKNVHFAADYREVP